MAYAMSDGRWVVAVERQTDLWEPAPERECKMVSFDPRLALDEKDEKAANVEDFLYDRLEDMPVEELLSLVQDEGLFSDLALSYDDGTWTIEGTEDVYGEPVRWEGKAEDPVEGFWSASHELSSHLAEWEDPGRVAAGLMDRTPMKPLFLYDHSGLALSTSDSFVDRQWDVSLVGFAYFDRETAQELEESGAIGTERALDEIIEADVQMLDDYLEGVVYKAEVYDAATGERETYCGFYLTDEEKRDDGRAFASDVAEGYTSMDPESASIEEGSIHDGKAFDLEAFAEKHGIELEPEERAKGMEANVPAPTWDEEREIGPKR